MKKFVKLAFAMVIAMAFAFMGCKHSTSEPEPAPTPMSYTVIIRTGGTGGAGGMLSVDKLRAQKGETVTLTIVPGGNSKLDSISVKDASNNDIGTTTIVTGTTYTFVMPESNVTVWAIFKLANEGITGSQVFIEGRRVEIIPTLWMCDHEVTQAEYTAVMGMGMGTNPSHFTGTPADGETKENRPVECVSWYDCLVYCNKRSMAESLTPCYTISGKTNPAEWGEVPTTSNETWNAVTCNFDVNGYRLPTEAEWEYMARGGNTTNEGQTAYSGSDTIGDVAWYRDNSDEKTHEVKKKAPNAKGIYDMSGNVLEWCWDRYGTIESDTPSSGASSGSLRVSRGGDWYSNAGICSVAYRSNDDPGSRNYLLGFRLVRSTN